MRASSSSFSSLTRCPFERVAALARRVEAADQVHQRRLARARRTHDGDVFVVLDAQADAAQRVHLLLGAHVVRLPQILDDNDIALRR